MRVRMQYGTEFTPWAIEAYSVAKEPAELLGRLSKIAGWELFGDALGIVCARFEHQVFMASIK